MAQTNRKKANDCFAVVRFFWFVLKNSLVYFIFRYLNINGCCKVHINNQQYDFENVNTFCTKSHQIAQLWLFFFALFCHVIHLQRHFYFGKLGFKSCETKRCIVRVLRIVFDHWTKEIIEQKRTREKKTKKIPHCIASSKLLVSMDLQQQKKWIRMQFCCAVTHCTSKFSWKTHKF